jgi:hypothetical protein
MKHLTTPRSPVSCSSIVGHKVDPRETAQKTAVKASGKKKKRTGARNISKLTNVHLLEKVGTRYWFLRGRRNVEMTVFDRVSTCRRITCQSRRGAPFSCVWARPSVGSADWWAFQSQAACPWKELKSRLSVLYCLSILLFRP